MVDINVDYTYYQNEYKGDIIPPDFFDKYINDAYLKTYNSIYLNLWDLEESETDIIKKIKDCQCEIAEFNYQYGLNSQQNTENQLSQSPLGVGEVKSETVGSTSRTYVTTLEAYSTRIQEIASTPEKYEDDILKKYLSSTGLLYRGVQ